MTETTVYRKIGLTKFFPSATTRSTQENFFGKVSNMAVEIGMIKTGSYLIDGELYRVEIVTDDGFLMEDTKGTAKFLFFGQSAEIIDIMKPIVIN